jgi:hypothetical protein
VGGGQKVFASHELILSGQLLMTGSSVSAQQWHSVVDCSNPCVKVMVPFVAVVTMGSPAVQLTVAWLLEPEPPNGEMTLREMDWLKIVLAITTSIRVVVNFCMFSFFTKCLIESKVIYVVDSFKKVINK